MKENETIQRREFKDLSDHEIHCLNTIFNQWFQENSPQKNKGIFIYDKIDFIALREDGQKSNWAIGQIYFYLIDKNPVAYILCFTKPENKKPYSFREYIKRLETFIPDDVEFVSSLYHVGKFAFIYHIGVDINYPHEGIGSKFLNLLMDFELKEKRKILIAASTLDLRQFGMFRFLRNARKNNIRFLDHHFSKREVNEMRFRIVEIFDKSEFLRQINQVKIDQIYDITIPVQLNFATESINNLISRKLNAKILWTSFFQENNQLINLNGIKSAYHGYYQPIQDFNDSTSEETREKILDILIRISRYLYKKHHQTEIDSDRVASILPAMKYDGFEFFLINDDPGKHDFSAFSNPKVYNVSEANSHIKFLQEPELYINMQEGSKNNKGKIGDKKIDWLTALHEYIKYKKRNNEELLPKAKKEWEDWKIKLGISENEASLLEFHQLNFRNKEYRQKIKDIKPLFNRIRANGFYSSEEISRWEAWFTLHKKLFEADFSVLPKSEQNKYWWCHAVVPVSFTRGLIGVMFSFRCKKQRISSEERSTLIANLAENISSALSRNMLNITGKLHQNNFEIALNRSGAAALSARNLSHYIGSHILNYLEQPEEIERIIEMEPSIDYYSENLRKFKPLANLLGFIRTRMSLLADMATNEPVASVAAWLNKDIIEPFNRDQSILRNYLKLNTLGEIGIGFVLHQNATGKDIPESDISVQMPNGELGRSAFYMIIVNFIRNSIKYCLHPGPEYLFFQIIAKRAENSTRLWEIIIHDNIDRNEKEVNALVKKINETYIPQELFDLGQYKLIKEGLGIAEILAAARYLRKRPFGNTWGRKNPDNFPYLTAVKIPSKSIGAGQPQDRFNLGLRFYLKRPRPLLLVDDPGFWNDYPHEVSFLSNHGIKLSYPNRLSNWNQESFSHEIALDLSFDDISLLDKAKAFPIRWVKIKNPQTKSILRRLLSEGSEEALQMAINETWQHWYNQYIRSKKSALHEIFTDPLDLEKNTSVIFDDHVKRLENSSSIDLLNNAIYYEAYRSNSPTALIINQIKDEAHMSDPGNRRLRLQLEESVRLSIVIIDERIQNILSKKELPIQLKNHFDSYFQYLEKMGIFIPDPTQQENDHPNLLSHEELKQDANKLLKYLARLIQTNCADFVVFHIGLIETIVGTSQTNIINDWIKKNLLSNNSECILISGRGKPQALPDFVRYAPYNGIAQYILDEFPSKFHLCQHLFSSRTRV